MTLRGVRVLLLEDDEDSRESLRWLLEGYGAQVTAVDSDSLTPAVWEQAIPDVIVSDMPCGARAVADLIQKIRAVDRERGTNTAAIALSSWGMAGEREQVLRAGFDAYLPKPADIDALLNVLRDATHPSAR